MMSAGLKPLRQQLLPAVALLLQLLPLLLSLAAAAAVGPACSQTSVSMYCCTCSSEWWLWAQLALSAVSSHMPHHACCTSWSVMACPMTHAGDRWGKASQFRWRPSTQQDYLQQLLSLHDKAESLCGSSSSGSSLNGISLHAPSLIRAAL